MYVTVLQLCNLRPELFQKKWLFITGINMHEYYQQVWYFKNEEGIYYKYIPLAAGHCD